MAKRCLCGSEIVRFISYPPDDGHGVILQRFGIVGVKADGTLCCSALHYMSLRGQADQLAAELSAREDVDFRAEAGLDLFDDPAELEAEYMVDSDPCDVDPPQF